MRTAIIKSVVLIAAGILLTGCTVSDGNDLASILVHLQRSLEPIWGFLIAFSYVLGICFIVIAIMRLKQYGQMTVMMSTHASLGPTLAYIIVGAGLLFLPTLLDIMSVTLWDYGVDDIRGFDQTIGFHEIMIPIIQLIQVLGLISFIRGWILLTKIGGHSGQPGTLNKAVLHILGGILAINIVGTIDVLQATFGLV